MARTKPRPASKRNAQEAPESILPPSQPLLKRQKTTTQPEEEIADDTTAKDNIRHLFPKRKVENPPKPSHTKSLPSSTSEVIDLTIDEEWHEVFGGQAWMSKNFPDVAKEQAEERRRKRDTLRSKMPRSFPVPAHELHFDIDAIEEEGEQNWAVPKQLSDRIRAHAQKEEQRSREKQLKKQKQKQEKQKQKQEKRAVAANSTVATKSEASSIMFTIPEAIAALKKRSSARNMAYDLPTGANLSYPVKRSYHLGAIGRYGATPAIYQLPYRAPPFVKSKPRSYNTWSDYRKATD